MQMQRISLFTFCLDPDFHRYRLQKVTKKAKDEIPPAGGQGCTAHFVHSP